MKRDQIRVGPEISPGRRASLRRIDGEVTRGVFGPVQEGRPLPEGAELLKVHGKPDGDGWCDVEVLYRHSSVPAAEPPAEAAPRQEERLSGPAQVATPAYRKGYDRIFGKGKIGLA